ncbi:MAG: hypothetical protein EBZ59_11385 [Planctomycetia bacterium]|nr:hypothetical protein [Planctomycetia bacterium]
MTFTENGGPVFSSEAMTAESGLEAQAADESVAIAGDGFCPTCSGAGCSQCGKRAIFDLAGCHDHGNGCWIGRADALLLWRNAPPGGVIVGNDSIADGNALGAFNMDSTPAAGPRFSIFRVNKCTGNGIEATYLRAANFRSIRPLGELPDAYELPVPGIYGNGGLTFDSANADLGARLQSFEFNRHLGITRNLRFLAGFRWIEWQEQFSMQTYVADAPADSFQTNCYNDLYGGQIGLDANLLATQWIRVDSVVKAGAYYNEGAQSSVYSSAGGPTGVYAADSPLSGAFAGEVGMTGVIPLTCCLDLRVGYFGLWLSGIAQPTQQLDGQVLPVEPTSATINSNGGVLVQGVSLGLEGRW